MSKITTVKEYIDSYPEDIKKMVITLRKILNEEIPGAEEVISYGIPTLKLNGKYVIYFSGYKKHVSLYPASDEMASVLPDITNYRTGKGTLQFPLDKPLPIPLIRKIAKFLLEVNQKRTSKK